MSWFKRLIGKLSGSDIGRKIIGKTAKAASGLIGKAENAYGGFKKSLPSSIQNGLSALENDPSFARDTKASYHQAKREIEGYHDYDK